MEKEEIVRRVARGENYKRLEEALSASPQAKVCLKGYVGSWLYVAAAQLLGQLKTHLLVVCADKEAAGYAYGDLRYLCGEDRALFYPASYRRPYQSEEVDNANVLLRGEVLSALASSAGGCCVVSYPEALFEKVVSRQGVVSRTFEIAVGDTLPIDRLVERLEGEGFERAEFVFSAGQYAVRGGIVDIFSFSADTPYRVEFFGDQVESIRPFDLQTQLSQGSRSSFSVMGNLKPSPETEKEYRSFFDFLPEGTLVLAHNIPACAALVGKRMEKAREDFSALKENSPLKHLLPEELFLDEGEFRRGFARHRVLELSQRPFFEGACELDSGIVPQAVFHRNFQLLGQTLSEGSARGLSNVIFCANDTQIRRLKDIFADVDRQVRFEAIEGELHEGFTDASASLACYTDHQIFERYQRYAVPRQYTQSQALSLSQLAELEVGDYVTHIDHGIGRFGGLQKIDVDGRLQEAVKLIYAGGDILYVSIHSFHKIAKYSGKEASQPRVDRLGSGAWKALKDRAKKRVKQVAFDLIKLYAARRAVKGYAFSPDTYLQNELEASFIYEDTPDQLKATQAVKADMESDRPMDRLVCGDVGFGKTEVAIRAAFKAACDSKQVAVLVPTTILAFQHYRSFASRLKRMPVRVDYLNRFRSPKEKAAILKDLAEGKIDILIGTHQIVGKNVKFKDLGLLIVDEEHKFGVGVKDKLKTLRTNVDTLTLTATPIPRTLQFSLMSARDLSVIATPPPNRHPIHTQVVTFDRELIRDAIARELARGGQVFFIHNRIENIYEVAALVQELVPDARIVVGHGQMKGEELEKRMLDFMEGRYDVLVSTSIVESGLDIPNANTILVNNAHQFGLSDLHQLRGRVGRSNKNAYCYYIAPPYSAMTDDARHRLEALEKYSAIGQGINIAMKDLEIRGAGDLLGAEQSGFIADIGFDTYQKILSEAVEELRHEEFADVFAGEGGSNDTLSFVAPDTQLDTDFELLIPDDYVSSSVERLRLYNTLSGLKTDGQLEDFAAQLRDRFGPLPPQVTDLLSSIRLKWEASELGFEKLVIKKGILRAHFPSDSASPYYRSEVFSSILAWGGTQGNRCRFEEKPQRDGRKALVMRLEGVRSLAQARETVDSLARAALKKPE